jgi:acyl carrier protein
MTISGLTATSRTADIKPMREGLAANEVRTIVADCLGVDLKCVVDEAHFIDDLGADWLDRVELMMAIEDRFVSVEITDGDVDHIHTVGDLIGFIESAACAR